MFDETNDGAGSDAGVNPETETGREEAADALRKPDGELPDGENS